LFQNTPSLDFSANPDYEAEFKFYDKKLLEAVRAGNEDVEHFFCLLALCHTVMAEERSGKYLIGCREDGKPCS